MANTKKLLQAAAGTAAAAGGGAAGGTDVTDVFSTYLYEGTGSSQVFENGINLGQSFGSGGADIALNGGASNASGYVDIATSTDFGFGTGDFTIEAFVFPRAAQNFSAFFSTMTTTSPPTGVMVGTYSDGSLNFDFNSISGGASRASALTIGVWSHVALTRNGTSVNLWVNGTSVATATSSDDLGSNQAATIGRFYTTNTSFGFNGYLSNVRVIKGTALYTSSFTAPTSELTAVSGTVLLALQGDEPFTDNSSSSHTLTQVSTVSASTFGPFDAADAGEGGLVWIKSRTESTYGGHALFDTERGATNPNYVLSTSGDTGVSATAAQYTSAPSTNDLTSFNANGFSLGPDTYFTKNTSGQDYVSWTFRKAPKFFTCLTYTGDGTSSRQISHDLNHTVGSVIVKRTDTTGDWWFWHRSATTYSPSNLKLNSNAAEQGGSGKIESVSSTTFTIGSANDVNASGGTYVAYLFAHNDGDGTFGPNSDQDIIKCGSFTGNSANGNFVDVGFEPQFLLLKNASANENWWIFDNMRGVVTGGADARLLPNLNNAESSYDNMTFNATGFTPSNNNYVNGSGHNMIYIAIRRGPLASPTDATEVFAVDQGDTTSTPAFNSGFVTDFNFYRNVSSSGDFFTSSRLTGTKYLATNSTAAESSSSSFTWDHMDGFREGTLGTTFYSWMWKRAPGFFDAIAYTGNGTAGRTVSHNLGVAPEMMWVKARNASQAWAVYHSGMGNTKYMRLSDTTAPITSSTRWNDTSPTDSVFTVGTDSNVNNASNNYIAYLFASLDGVSKVGSYTGTGTSSLTVDCGFSSGARFVMIKRTDGAGNWTVFDAERGIVAGADPFLYLNLSNAEATSGDRIDPNSTGFEFNNDGNWGDVNASGGTYIFYAIA